MLCTRHQSLTDFFSSSMRRKCIFSRLTRSAGFCKAVVAGISTGHFRHNRIVWILSSERKRLNLRIAPRDLPSRNREKSIEDLHWSGSNTAPIIQNHNTHHSAGSPLISFNAKATVCCLWQPRHWNIFECVEYHKLWMSHIFVKWLTKPLITRKTTRKSKN